MYPTTFMIAIREMPLVCISILIVALVISNQSVQYRIVSGQSELVDFNVAAVGDWGCNSDTKDTLNNILSKSPELVIGLGDYSYQDTADCWLDIIEPIREKMKIAIGNHEDDSSYLLNQYLNKFNLTRQYYSFNYSGVHFLVLQPKLPLEVGSQQYNFAKNDLASAASDNNLLWSVVVTHLPVYSSPAERAAETPLRENAITNLREIYHSLFEKYDVDIVLQAHLHAYERTYPLVYNDKEPLDPIVTDKQTETYQNPEGEIFITVGTGGYRPHYFTDKSPYIAAQHEGSGFLNIDMLNNGTQLSAKFYDNSGSLSDHFTLTKGL